MAVIRIKNKVNAGGIPEGLTQGELAVNLSDRSLYVGGTVGNSIFISGVQSFNGATGDVLGAGLAGNTFTGLNHFQAGISAAGATIGTLIVHRGISASGGVTFQNNLYVGGNISLEGDVSLVDESGSYFVEFVRSVGTTSDLPAVGTAGQIFWVRGPTSGIYVQNYSGYYFWDDFVVPNGWTGDPAQISAKWVRLTNATQYNVNDLNQDGIINGIDLSSILAAWGSQGYSGGNFAVALTNGSQNAFEVKIFGVTTGKKASAFRITSDVTDPQIFMKAGTVDVDGNLVVKDLTSGIDSVLRVEGSRFSSAPLLRVVGAEGITGGYSIFQCGVVFDGGTGGGMTFSNSPVTIGSLLTLNGGLSAGCGVTFNCLTHFTAGLSGSGATLGRLVVNSGISAAGGVTFANDIFVSGARVGVGPAGTNNTVMGVAAGGLLQSGSDGNVAIGRNSLQNATSGDYNVGIGYNALQTLTTTTENIGIGLNALRLTTSTQNVAVGTDALANTGNANSNTAVGHNALRLNLTGTASTAVGSFAGFRNLASSLVGVGYQSLFNNTIGTSNVAVGRDALLTATTQAATVTIGASGSGGTDGVYRDVQLTYVSGASAATYPTVNISIAGGVVTGVTIANGGNAFTATSGTVMTATGASAGNISGFTCALATVNTAANNTAIGNQSAFSLTVASNCTAVGASSLLYNTSGPSNTAIGTSALAQSTIGLGANTAIGHNAATASTTVISAFTTTPVSGGSGYTPNQTLATVTLVKKRGAGTFAGTVQAQLTTDASGVVTAIAATPISSGSRLTASDIIFEPSPGTFGSGSGAEISIATLTSAELITAVGSSALQANVSGLYLTAVGQSALSANTTGNQNTAVGRVAGASITTGSNNVAVGEGAMRWGPNTGSSNTAVGRSALAGSSTTPTNSSNNVAIGASSHLLNSTGSNNVSVGVSSLLNHTTGSGNVALGHESARYVGTSTVNCTVSTNSIFIGADSRPSADSQTNQIVIGNSGRGDGSNTTVIGNSSTTSTRVFGTLSTNGGISAAGATLSGTVFVGATLSMNSNIQLNQNFRIFGGVVDGGVYT